jgi:hypothetical protein
MASQRLPALLALAITLSETHPTSQKSSSLRAVVSFSRAESVAKRGGKNESMARRYHARALRARGVELRGPKVAEAREAAVKAITLSARKS